MGSDNKEKCWAALLVQYGRENSSRLHRRKVLMLMSIDSYKIFRHNIQYFNDIYNSAQTPHGSAVRELLIDDLCRDKNFHTKAYPTTTEVLSMKIHSFHNGD